MSISIKLTQTDQKIKALINEALAQSFNIRIQKRQKLLLQSIKDTTREVMSYATEIKELQSGILKADFGLASDPTLEIIESIASTVNITLKKIKANSNNITGGIRVTIQPQNYNNLYALNSSIQRIKYGSLPWLKWLLEAGDSVLIVDFGVEYGPFGRTGMAQMTNEERPFKVNSNYSGVKDNNFISRTFQKYEKKFMKTIIEVIK